MASILCVTLTLAVLSGASEVSPVQSETFRLLTRGGEKSVEAAERFLDISFSNGTIRGAVVVFFEPKSRLFVWVFSLSGSSSRPGLLIPYRRNAVLCLADERLVFFALREDVLGIAASAERAATLEDAVRQAVSFVEARREEFTRLDFLLTGTDLTASVDLKELGRDFFVKKDTVGPGSAPQVLTASYSDGKWEVTLRGPNNDQAIVTLDSSFRLQGTRRIE